MTFPEEESIWLGARGGDSRADRDPGGTDKTVVPVTMTPLSTRKFFPQNPVATTEVNFFFTPMAFFHVLSHRNFFYMECSM